MLAGRDAGSTPSSTSVAFIQYVRQTRYTEVGGDLLQVNAWFKAPGDTDDVVAELLATRLRQVHILPLAPLGIPDQTSPIRAADPIACNGSDVRNEIDTRSSSM